MADIARKRRIGIKQAKRTIEKIERRITLGIAKPNDEASLRAARQTLKKWQATNA